MRKLIKYSVIFLILVFAALFTAPFFMDIDDYRREAVSFLEKKTGRSVEIQQMQVSLFPWIGVQLDQVRMGNASQFGQQDFISAKHVDVQLALLPLLSGEIRIKRFVLDTPHILLQRKANGQTNWQDLIQKQTSDQATSEPTPNKSDTTSPNAFGKNLSAKNIHLQSGKLIWMDGDKVLKISQLNLEINGIYLDKPVPIHFSGQIGDSPFQLQAKVGPIGDLENLDIQHLPLQAELTIDALLLRQLAVIVPALSQAKEERLSLNIKLEQQPDGMKRSLGYLSLQAKQQWKADWTLDMPSLDQLKIHEINLHIDQQQVASISGEVKDITKKLNYEARLKVDTLKRDQITRWLPQLQTLYQNHPEPWQQLEMAMLLSGNLKQVELRDMQLILNNELVQISGNASFAKTIPSIRLRIAADQLHLDPWLPFTPKDNIEKQATDTKNNENSPPAVEPDLRFLKAFHVNTELQVGQLNAKGLDISHVQMTAALKRGLLTIKPFSFDLNGGHIQQTFKLNANNFPASWSENIQIKRVQIKPLLMLAADSSMLSGLMQVESTMRATGLTPENMIPSLNGQGHFVLRDGEIEGFDIGAILNTLSPAKGNKKKTYFSQLSGSYKMHKGVMTNNDLFMASPLFRLSAHGVVNLVQKNMDYYAKPKLVANTTGQGATQGANKGMVVPLRIYGPLSDPKVSLNVKLQDIFSAPNALKQLKAPAVQKMISPNAGKQADDIRKSIKNLLPSF